MKKFKLSNALLLKVVLNYCKKNFNLHEDGKYTIEILDFHNMGLSYEEADLIYSHIETGDAVEFVRSWFVENRGHDVGAAAQDVVAKDIMQFFNVHYMRRHKNTPDPRIFKAIIYHLGNSVKMAMPEDAIISAVREFIENNYK